MMTTQQARASFGCRAPRSLSANSPVVRRPQVIAAACERRESCTGSRHRARTGALAAAAALLLSAGGASARPEGVNKPELLPAEPTTVIDVAGFLTSGEEARMQREISSLERDTGVKLRVLAQNYPMTPGLAIRDYWGVDADTVVFVADPTFGNILNFNIGENVDLKVPRNFWTRLAGLYGNKFYWQKEGEGRTITNVVGAIDTCLREPIGRNQCSKIQRDFGEEPSTGRFGQMFGL